MSLTLLSEENTEKESSKPIKAAEWNFKKGENAEEIKQW